MKVSLKLDDDRHRHLPLLLRTKIPISIFNLPFNSHFSTSTTNPSQLSLALSTNFSTGPSLKLSYATAAAAAFALPLTLTLKSGTGLFGSPKNSPLNISAQFSFNPSNLNNPNPTFCLYFKPQLGSFSLRKSIFSHSKPDLSSCDSSTDNSFDSNSFDFVPLERPTIGVKNSSVGENGKNSIVRGIQLAAATQMTVAKRVALSFRWLMEFPEEKSAITMPILRIKKIGIQRIPDYHVLKVEGGETIARRDDSERELEVLKGAFSWMKKELTDLTRVNREMRCELEEIKLRSSESFELKGIQKKDNIPSTPGFEQWKRRRGSGVEENVNVSCKKEEKKKNSDRRPDIDVESELQKAIMAAEAAAAASH